MTKTELEVKIEGGFFFPSQGGIMYLYNYQSKLKQDR